MAGTHPRLTIAVVNRFYPPDPAITGVSAQELVEFLRRRLPQAEIRVHATRARYAGGQARVADQAGVSRVRSWYDGQRKLPRLLASLVDGLRLALAATRGSDVVISLTDPPLLGLWMGLLRIFRRYTWVEWTMDLYPDAFASAGLVTPRNALYRALHHLVSRWAPARYIALGPKQHEFLERSRGGAVPAFILPCGIGNAAAGPVPEWRRQFARHVVLAYAGNLGEAHDHEPLVDLVRRADPARFRFLIALYGSKAEQARRQLAGIGHILWRDSIAPAELAHADVHLACLQPEWAHVCVPSKAVSSICLGRPILYWGAQDSDIWALLGAAGWRLAENPDAVLAAIADPVARAAKTAQAQDLRTDLLNMKEAAFEQLAAWLGGLRSA